MRSVVNRLYYSHFYAISALLIFEKYTSSKHSGVLSFFNQNFIKTKIFDEESGKAANRLFEMRNRGDYREFVRFNENEINELINATDSFLKKVDKYLSTKNTKQNI